MHGTNVKISDYVIQLFCKTNQVDSGNKKKGKYSDSRVVNDVAMENIALLRGFNLISRSFNSAEYAAQMKETRNAYQNMKSPGRLGF